MSNDIMRLADEYAHCYAFVGDDTMPIKRAELEAAIATLQAKVDSLEKELQEEARLNGMGSEREAAQLSKIDRLTAKSEPVESNHSETD